MKITAFLIFIALMQIYALSFGQKITLKQKEASLEKVLSLVRKQSNYNFLYTTDAIKKAKPVTIDVKDANIDVVLALCFKDQPLSYSVIDEVVVIKEIPAPQLAANVPIILKIHGRVSNDKGRPLAGAGVRIKRTGKGVSADSNGEFELEVQKGDVLAVSYVSLEAKEITIGENTNLQITLAESENKLNQVVVIGYGSRRSADITSAISSISSKDIERSTALTPELALQGQAAGVQVTSAGGDPTARPTVRIRGVSSFNYSDPLYVIDGVPLVEGGAGATVDKVNSPTLRGPVNIYTILNPNDIESISVLKDASAAAIYGMRAANGVILITTKKGKKGSARIEFDGQLGNSKFIKNYKALNTQQYTKYYTDMYNAYPQ